jgi:hypothetical protein
MRLTRSRMNAACPRREEVGYRISRRLGEHAPDGG